MLDHHFLYVEYITNRWEKVSCVNTPTLTILSATPIWALHARLNLAHSALIRNQWGEIPVHAVMLVSPDDETQYKSHYVTRIYSATIIAVATGLRWVRRYVPNRLQYADILPSPSNIVSTPRA